MCTTLHSLKGETMKKVFLTGATGIMGMEAVKRFAEHSDEIALYALARPGKKN